MILQNDNYTTIVAAIQEGRIVFDNLIKFITYLISCNISEIIIIFISAILRDPLPLLPIHLLWINLVTDGFPSLALGMEPGEKDIMQRRPRDVKDGILNSRRWLIMAVEGVTMGMAVYTAFKVADHYFGLEVARTVTFLALNCAQLVHSLNSRSEKKSLFTVGITENKFLLWVFIISIAAQFPVMYSVVGEKLFKAVDLSWNQLGIAFVAGIVPFVVVETLKIFRRMDRAKA
jgi:Ca2+-transporting ATPase